MALAWDRSPGKTANPWGRCQQVSADDGELPPLVEGEP